MATKAATLRKTGIIEEAGLELRPRDPNAGAIASAESRINAIVSSKTDTAKV